MWKYLSRIGCLLALAAIWLTPMPARAESLSPESIAAAKELVATIKLGEQFNSLMPTIMTTLKPAIVQGRANVERDYDAMIPLLLQSFQSRMDELSDAVVKVYASNFTADDLRALIVFYKTPVGQKFLQKTPLLAQQTMAVGQQFGRSVASEIRTRMIEELRKKGHAI
ncbi:DUF2059 domain-containing protein [Nitrobacter sp.]|uniref:DUF2059 domain-containing protein n=1 Tax=Nitrobacter sp. TaxID=29420 RepID=UPI003F64D954